jgi:carbon storage regulator
MLVLTRKKNESIVIDKDITVTVLEIKGDRVRLGFDAPGEVSIHRKEVWTRMGTNQPKTEEPHDERRQNQTQSKA